jgi:hypothetical protein
MLWASLLESPPEADTEAESLPASVTGVEVDGVVDRVGVEVEVAFLTCA